MQQVYSFRFELPVEVEGTIVAVTHEEAVERMKELLGAEIELTDDPDREFIEGEHILVTPDLMHVTRDAIHYVEDLDPVDDDNDYTFEDDASHIPLADCSGPHHNE